MIATEANKRLLSEVKFTAWQATIMDIFLIFDQIGTTFGTWQKKKDQRARAGKNPKTPNKAY